MRAARYAVAREDGLVTRAIARIVWRLSNRLWLFSRIVWEGVRLSVGDAWAISGIVSR